MNRTQEIDKAKWLESLVAAHVKAAIQGVFAGQVQTPYFQSCRRVSPFAGLVTIFTRDVGYHTSGWWKNPDYERCFHLSVSFFDTATHQSAPQDKSVVAKLVEGFFGQYAKWVWCEGPYSERGKARGVHHYRLFCDAAWQPIKPRGEVYSRELTAAGWKSWSDVQAEKKARE